jgi:hypothetical protein
MSIRSPFNTDISALLAARNQAPGYLNSQYLGATGLPPAAGLGASQSQSNNSELLTLLINQQAQERQQKALFAQQVASLGGLGSLGIPPPPTDNLSYLIQQKQLQALQGFGAGGGGLGGGGFGAGGLGAGGLGAGGLGAGGFGAGGFGTGCSSLDRLASLRAAAAQDLSLLGGQSPSQLEALSKILQSQQQPQVGANGALGLSHTQGGSLALPMDRKRKGRTGTFPQKLHQILLDLERQEGGTEIASFLPHGRAFAIHKPREFVKHVMPKYFRMSRFSSFQRQLNLYDFQRVTEGPDKGAYYHELFVQGRPILATMMKRNKIKGVKRNDDNSSNGERDADEPAETVSR